MNKAATILALALVAIVPASAEAGALDDEYYRNKAQKHLQLASIWLIEEGVLTFRESGKEGIHRKLVDEWGVQIWVDPWIESDRYINAFWIKARGINHDIINFHRERLPSGIYEFWVVKIDGKDWSGVGSSANFHVARTDDIYGRRVILESSDQFIQEYTVDDNTSISFPVDDPRILYELQAWRYPENFENSDIDETRAEMKSDGSIELIK
ncbi:hypothetical protein [Pelagibius sp.]|uniref:hypothetical protein n=1 Tax=Pelagibius sp. TaxID=1931238 RepID=UPI0026203F50|nr:hypothetical protein [Pelagibius sp.]